MCLWKTHTIPWSIPARSYKIISTWNCWRDNDNSLSFSLSLPLSLSRHHHQTVGFNIWFRAIENNWINKFRCADVPFCLCVRDRRVSCACAGRHDATIVHWLTSLFAFIRSAAIDLWTCAYCRIELCDVGISGDDVHVDTLLPIENANLFDLLILNILYKGIQHRLVVVNG